MILEGEIDFLCNDANIPVDIWLTKESEKHAWQLTADNYMPRKGYLAGENTIKIRATTREELAEIVREKIIPLYESALKQLNLIVEGKAKSLYYWEIDEDVEEDKELT